MNRYLKFPFVTGLLAGIISGVWTGHLIDEATMARGYDQARYVDSGMTVGEGGTTSSEPATSGGTYSGFTICGQWAASDGSHGAVCQPDTRDDGTKVLLDRTGGNGATGAAVTSVMAASGWSLDKPLHGPDPGPNGTFTQYMIPGNFDWVAPLGAKFVVITRVDPGGAEHQHAISVESGEHVGVGVSKGEYVSLVPVRP